MIDSYKINSLFDADVVDPDGSKIGTVKHVYVDPDGGRPLFAGVTTGWFGRAESFVPLDDADFDGEVLHVEYDKDTVKHAPRIDADGTLTDDDIDRIQDYYDGGSTDDDARHDDAREDDARDDDGAVTAESVVVDEQRPPRKRIRVHRYVVTDERAGTTALTDDDATLNGGRPVDETQYETVEEARVDRFDEAPAPAADESLDGGNQPRRHAE